MILSDSDNESMEPQDVYLLARFSVAYLPSPPSTPFTSKLSLSKIKAY